MIPATPFKPSKLTIIQLVISIIAFFLSLLGVIISGIFLLIGPSINTVLPSQLQAFPNWIWICLLAAAITIPSMVYAIQVLRGKPEISVSRRGFLFSSLALTILPVLVFLGYKAVSNQVSSWITGFLNILVIAIPIWWIVEYSCLRLVSVTKLRQWGLMTFGVFLTQPIIILIEIICLVIGVGFAAAWLMQQPESAPLITRLQSQLMFTSLDNSQDLIPQLRPLLMRPGLIAAGLLGISLVIPLIEELFKPMALWFLSKRGLSPADGFIAGILSGAAFALLESLYSVSAVPSEAWLPTVIGRIGTGLLHIFTTGLNGWALASTWNDRKFLRVGIVYLVTVLVHGLWNASAVLMGLSQVTQEFDLEQITGFTQIAPRLMLVLAVGMITTLFYMNRTLRTKSIPPLLPVESIPGLG